MTSPQREPGAEALAAVPEIDRLLDAIVERRLETPAIMFLELHRPLGGLLAQSAVLSWPLLAPLLGLDRYRQLCALLEDRNAVALLLDRLEARARGKGA